MEDKKNHPFKLLRCLQRCWKLVFKIVWGGFFLTNLFLIKCFSWCSYASLSTFFHAGNSSFHSFGWPPVLVSFSMRSSVIHLVSFLSPFTLSLSRALFWFLSAIKGKLNPRDGPHPDWISGTCFFSSLSHHGDAAVVVPFHTQRESVNSFKIGTTLIFPPCQALAKSSGSECWLLSEEISQEYV